jgi:hypothetical protein
MQDNTFGKIAMRLKFGIGAASFSSPLWPGQPSSAFPHSEQRILAVFDPSRGSLTVPTKTKNKSQLSKKCGQ